jgi:hypothetical protein
VHGIIAGEPAAHAALLEAVAALPPGSRLSRGKEED